MVVEKMTGAKAVVQTLKSYKVKYFFGIPGSTEPIYSEIAKIMPEMLPILPRDEKSGAHMADGYARISYKPGVCTGCQGPGTTNLVSGIAEAYLSSTPVIAITAARSTAVIDKNAYQELDHYTLLKPITKWSFRLGRADRIPEMLRKAFRIATSGRPGPVQVDIHADAISGEAEVDVSADEEFAYYPSLRAAPDPSKVKEAADLLMKAERPIMIAGGGAVMSQTWTEVAELADLLGIPVATTLSGKGIIPENHPLAVGVVGSYCRRCANKVVQAADLVLFIGCKTGANSTDNWTKPPLNTRIIHIDVDPTEICRNYRTELGIVADARIALRELLAVLKTKIQKASTAKSSRLREIQIIVKEWRDAIASARVSEDTPVKPQRIIKELQDFLAKDDIIVADTGYSSVWTGAHFDCKVGGRTYINASGTLGFGFPASIGAKLAAPDKKVVCFIGDGGFGYHVGELETALRHEVPVVVVIMNNMSLNFEKQYMKFYGMNFAGVPDFLDVDFGKVAEAFGCFGARVERPGEIRDALRNAFESGKPGVLDIVTDPEVVPPVTFFDKYAVGY